MPEAARVDDAHTCSKHGPGPVLTGSANVLIGGAAAARKGDTALCPGAIDGIIEGAETVLLNGLPAARKGDPTDGGSILVGMPTVLIGPTRQSAALQQAAEDGDAFVEKCK